MNKKSKYLSVSAISAYAADPRKYCKHRGQAYNQQAAQRGEKMHNRAGKGSLLPALVLVLALIFMAYWFLG